MTSAILITALATTPGFVGDGKYPIGPVPVAPEAPHGYTYSPARDLNMVVRYPAYRYDPQPGDVILMSDTNAVWTIIYAFALTGAPGHGGVVARMPDGRMGILEAGFNQSLRTRFLPLDYRLNHYPGKVWVRRLRQPLNPWQDARLTEFCVRSDNTRYNLLGVKLQFTPLSPRGPLRTRVAGRVRGPGQQLFCSEAILEALAYAGAIDPVTARPSATYPRDLFFDRSPNPYVNRHPPLAKCWEEPALWTPVLGVAAKGKERAAPAHAVYLPPPYLPPPPRKRLFRR